jgi:hypothetical protein
MAKKQNVAKKVAEVKSEAPAAQPEVRTELVIADPERTKGSVRYRIPGLVGSLRVARGLFAGAPPAKLIVIGGLATADPEREAKVKAAAADKVVKLEARLAKLRAVLAK